METCLVVVFCYCFCSLPNRKGPSTWSIIIFIQIYYLLRKTGIASPTFLLFVRFLHSFGSLPYHQIKLSFFIFSFAFSVYQFSTLLLSLLKYPHKLLWHILYKCQSCSYIFHPS
ncbi:hypothetical protein Lalb_Chr09g0321081 [Lupinus albus]|uniref:Uncharacterized protein n=1 Tax=Lupinus albus TaxID=3870 RepID=A0A6A4PZ74_LUPAL|nr:hypothetical protein Lalb_Chr09g0321081 [Lupinus albus]